MMQDAPPKIVMVQDEPKHHQVFHQGPVRILDVQIPPGEVTLFHTHDTAVLYVPISISPTDTQILGQEWLGVKPTDRSRFEGLVVASDTSYASKSLTHRVKNVGSKLFRLIAITNATNPAGAASSAPPGQAVLASNWYNAAELVLGSGTMSEWKTAASPTVIVLTGEGEAYVEVGGERKQLKTRGEWAVAPSGSQFRVGAEAGESKVVIVQANQ